MVQQFAGEVFGREFGLALQRPFDADCGVVPQQGVFGFGVVVVGAFVNEFGLFTQYIEAVGKAFGHPELVFVFGGEDGTGPLAKSGELRRRSTATSNTSPAITRTSLPWVFSVW